MRDFKDEPQIGHERTRVYNADLKLVMSDFNMNLK